VLASSRAPCRTPFLPIALSTNYQPTSRRSPRGARARARARSRRTGRLLYVTLTSHRRTSRSDRSELSRVLAYSTPPRLRDMIFRPNFAPNCSKLLRIARICSRTRARANGGGKGALDEKTGDIYTRDTKTPRASVGSSR